MFSKRPKLKRRCLIWGVVLFWFFSAPVFLNLLAKGWDIRQGTLPPGKTYSAAIILGGFAGDSNNGKGAFNWSADRFIQGILLQRSNTVKKLVISGGNGNLFSDGFLEADWVKKQLRTLQIPDSCILVENQSRNTLENASLTKTLLIKNHQQGPYLLVTSAFHMRRSLQIFKGRGVDVIAYPCNYIAGTGDFSFFELLPNADVLSKWSIYIKELIGFTVNVVTGKA